MQSASTPVANRQTSVPASVPDTKSAQDESGTRALSLFARSSIVSDTPRLRLMACAMSWSA